MNEEPSKQERTMPLQLVSPQLANQPDVPYCVPDEYGRCITCADEVLSARVVLVNEADWMALVDVDGQRMEVDISLVDGVAVGQRLLVHGGVALERERDPVEEAVTKNDRC